MRWLPIGIGAALGFALAWLVHMVIMSGVKEDHQQAMDKQKLELEASCLADKTLTEENSREWQDKVADLNRKLDTARRVLPTRCVVPATRKAGGGDGTPAGAEHARQDGVTSDVLISFAGECEKLRLQVISLQQFIDDVWKAKGQ